MRSAYTLRPAWRIAVALKVLSRIFASMASAALILAVCIVMGVVFTSQLSPSWRTASDYGVPALLLLSLVFLALSLLAGNKRIAVVYSAREGTAIHRS